jgi:hypothetical protein
MNESTASAPTSWFARKSHFWGVLSLLLLLLSGCIVLGMVRPGLHGPTQEEVTRLSWCVLVCHGLAVLAALVAIVLGIVALEDIGGGEGKVAGRGWAVAGLVTGTLTLLTLVVVYVVVPLILAWHASKFESKTESANNLKELGLAMHLYHDYHGHFPPAVLRDPALGDRGQPYSWRVALLPFLGEDALYSQYRRDEPWDSPANKAVLARMPRVFALPGSMRAAGGLTHYQLLVGPGTAFERPDLKSRLIDFPRGADQTILAVEAAVPVPWTKPEDLPYDPDGPLPKVGGLVGNGFHALFADASVRWFEAEEQENALRKLVPRNGR